MKKLNYKMASCYLLLFFCFSLPAQETKSNTTDSSELNKRKENYLELKNLGYKDQEIFEDLGNAHFLMENYETAVFWYKKLETISTDGLSSSYVKRYDYSLKKADKSEIINDNTNWLAVVEADYKTKKDKEAARKSKYKDLDFLHDNKPATTEEIVLLEENYDLKNKSKKEDYKSPIAVTADGKTAYFSKPIYVKPLYGVFSKKQLVYKIFKADKVEGQWRNIEEIALCPKNFSTKHPAVSADGKRLFFASNMPGTYGEYDIYVATINNNGSYGVAKNLGEKVNTKKNDVYPKIINDNTLVFASEGHKGYGGLDIYMASVSTKRVDWSTNLGSPINSPQDDFSLSITNEEGVGYVMSNRGKDKNTINKVVFTYSDKSKSQEKRNYKTLENLNDVKMDYTSSLFEDE